MALVVVNDTEVYFNAINKLKVLKHDFGEETFTEFKYNKTTKRFKSKFFSLLLSMDIYFYSIVVDKRSLKLKKPELKHLYNLCLSYGVEMLLPFKAKRIKFIIDGSSTEAIKQKMSVLLRNTINKKSHLKCKVRLVDSRKELMLQVADMIAGAIYYDRANGINGPYSLIKKLERGKTII